MICRLALLAVLVPASLLHADLYVAPAGSDANAGSADKPVATLKRAIELSRGVTAPRRIILRGGVYYDTSVSLAAEDSGLTIEAAPGEQPRLVGGVPLAGWEKDGEAFYSAALPPGRAWDVRLLEVNGRFCPRARFPREGTLTHLSRFDVRWMSSTGGGWQRKPTSEELTTLKYKPGDLPANLDIRSAEITVYHMWDESVSGIVSNDPQTQTLRLSPPLGHPAGAFGVKKYILWNLREGMTAPGQWYFDRTRGRIVYWPLPGENLSTAAVLIPTQTSLIRITNARNITVRNLALGVSTVPLVTGGFAAARFDGAISLNGTDNCRLENLVIANVAGQAIKAGRNILNTIVENCDVSSCGAGGIYVGGRKTLISNNLVHAVGLSFPSAIGITGGGQDNTVSHNEVHDTSYSAINYGGENCIIENNLIYDCMKVLHDGAAIYVFAAKNSIIRGNFARDFADTGGYGASAYYLDERSEGCVVENNFSLNVGWPSHNHMALKNTIRNNVFVVKGDAKITLPRSTGFTFSGNVLYATGSITFQGIDAITTWSRNLLYSGANKIEGKRLKDYATTATVSGVCGDTTVADPLFVDLAHGDYRYKPDSPALKLGLKPLDPSQAGRKTAH